MHRTALALMILLIALAPAGAKQGRGRGRGHDEGGPPSERGNGKRKAAPVRAFRADDCTVIMDYYRAQPGGLPPGLAKRNGDLPPGLEKQLRRNGTLPPGLAKKFMPFPPELEMRLPPCPPDVRRGFIGGVAVMYNSRTGLVLDFNAMFGR
jgi:hypothetical protein